MGIPGESASQRPALPPRGPSADPHSLLRWVRALPPGEEGTAWWAEVTSCLASTSDPVQRCRYLHSYRRSVPQRVWTSWTMQLTALCRRELL